MHFDTITMASIRAELTQTIIGVRVQQVVLPDEWSVGMEIFANHQRHNLLLSAHAQTSRVHLVNHKIRRGVESHTPLLLLLRKYVRGGRLTSIEQPNPVERVLNLHFDHTEYGITTLVIEAIGRQSNLILLDPGGKIMEVVRRSDAKNRTDGSIKQAVRPRQQYIPPMPQQKLSPFQLHQVEESQLLQQQLQALITETEGKQKLWRALTALIAGVSPTLAREIAWRATEDSEALAQNAEVDKITQATQEIWSLLQNDTWEPGLIMAGNATHELRAVGFTAYPAHILGAHVPVSSMSHALEQFYSQPVQENPIVDSNSGSDPYLAQRKSVESQLRKAIGRVERQLTKLAEDEPSEGEADHLRMQAEWLLALNSQIEPEQSVLEIDLGAEQKLAIKLDAKLKPVEQAERMFKRASKLERAAEIIPQRRTKLQNDLAFLEQLSVDLALSENQPEIVSVREELRKMGLLSSQQAKPQKMKQQSPTSRPLHYRSAAGTPILVGRNARQNEVVTFKIATADDMWLHVRDAPGSHVVIRSGGQVIDDATLQAAAQLAAYYSKMRGEKTVAVAVTSRRFVTRVSGGRPGQVYMRNEDTVMVTAELPADVLYEK